MYYVLLIKKYVFLISNNYFLKLTNKPSIYNTYVHADMYVWPQ